MEYTRDQILANREAWLKDLETTKDSQAHGLYFDGRNYCALGRAIKILNEYDLPKDSPAVIEKITGIPSYASRVLHNKYGLIDKAWPPEANQPGGMAHIIRLNDYHYCSFADIAATIRESPELYFEKV